MVLHLVKGERLSQRDLIRQLTTMQYTRNEVTLERSTYRVRGDVIDIHPAENDAAAIRVELFDDAIESISEFDPLTGELRSKLPRVTLFPKSHSVPPREKIDGTFSSLLAELKQHHTPLRMTKN